MNQKLSRTVDVKVNPERAFFLGRDVNGFEVPVDMAGKLGVPGGDDGLSPRDLLLIALAGCSGTSFIAAMRDAGQKMAALNIKVSGTIDDKPPQVFRHIALLFRVSGDHLDPEQVRACLAACHGSCSISATLQHVAQIDTDFEIVADPALQIAVTAGQLL